MEPRWRLEELAARVGMALSKDYEGAPNARVREVPDERVIRYYTTLGLVDRPAAYDGRIALYGPRHLRQIVAIKRLQAEGLSLMQVQERLAGLAPASLTRLARVPEEAETEGTEVVRQEARKAARKDAMAEERKAAPAAPARGRFWASPPAESPAPLVASGTTQAAGSLVGLPIAEGVTLLVGLARPLEAGDVEAVQEAAMPLLAMLEKRGMIILQRRK